MNISSRDYFSLYDCGIKAKVRDSSGGGHKIAFLIGLPSHAIDYPGIFI